MSRYTIEFIPSALSASLRNFLRVFVHKCSMLSTASHKIPGHMVKKSFMENSKNFIELIPEIIESFMKFTIRC